MLFNNSGIGGRTLDGGTDAGVTVGGGWHARKDVGVPLHVLDLGAARAPTVLMLAEQGAEVTAAMADFVWYTPATPAQDYCAQMRKQFGQ